MKKIILICLVLSMVFSGIPVNCFDEDVIALFIGSNHAIANGTNYDIDANNKDVVPIVENGRALIPVRFLADRLHMNVEWDDQSQIVLIYNDNIKLQLQIGSNVMFVNDAIKKIDENELIVAKTINDRTLVPLRAICEALNKQVFYDRGLILISDSVKEYSKTKLDEYIKSLNVLPTVGSVENLKELLGEFNTYPPMYTKQDVAVSPTNEASGAGNVTRSDDDYSTTNIQVDGVDEADVVKTDGEYIYKVSADKIFIAKATPVEQMSVTSIIKSDDGQNQPIELYVDGDKLVVISNMFNDAPRVYDSAKMIMPPYYNNNFVGINVYNISDKKSPILERTLKLEGSYLSSRKIDNNVYVITNKGMVYYNENIEPISYTDSVSGVVKIDYSNVRYFPGFKDRSFLTVASIDITKPNEKAIVQTMLGGGQNIYSSKDNLYVATNTYVENINKTVIYKFSVNAGDITYLGNASVEGSIINQFSMDEYNGNFRIATTVFDTQQYNNLYILDDTMTLRGKITNIAPDERIYSTRFVGNRGYMVTFKQVDPLFVLDLSNIDSPKILGKLKIPGYSNYIHPIDDNYIIGFGKDTIDVKGATLNEGMKMALFDITDVENPKEKFVEIIGDRGTDSPLLYNHKALLYAPQKNLLAFPVTVMTADDINSYGSLEFSGAYVYNFDVESGFNLKGKVSHFTKDDMLKLGDYPDYNKTIERILYINDSLLTTSVSRLEAHKISDLTFENSIDLK